jgi:hypothetical protein
MPGSSKCRIKGTLDRNSVGQIEADRMQSWRFGDSLQIAGRTPHFVTLSDEQLCEGQTNTRTRTSEKNSLHDFENLFRVPARQYMRCNGIDSYFKYRLDARVPAYFNGITHRSLDWCASVALR